MTIIRTVEMTNDDGLQMNVNYFDAEKYQKLGFKLVDSKNEDTKEVKKIVEQTDTEKVDSSKETDGIQETSEQLDAEEANGDKEIQKTIGTETEEISAKDIQL